MTMPQNKIDFVRKTRRQLMVISITDIWIAADGLKLAFIDPDVADTSVALVAKVALMKKDVDYLYDLMTGLLLFDARQIPAPNIAVLAINSIVVRRTGNYAGRIGQVVEIGKGRARVIWYANAGNKQIRTWVRFSDLQIKQP